MASELTPEQALTVLRSNLFVGTSVACAVSGKSRSQVARMAGNGSLPAVRSGKRWLFPTAPLLRMIGREDLIPEPADQVPANSAPEDVL